MSFLYRDQVKSISRPELVTGDCVYKRNKLYDCQVRCASPVVIIDIKLYNAKQKWHVSYIF